jgi:hypothetical protein
VSRGAIRRAAGLALLALSAAAARAESLTGTPAGPADRKGALEAYAACVTKPAGPNCPAIRSRVVVMIVEDLRKLATAPNRRFVSLFLAGLKAREPELRAAAADALAMAGPTAAETPALLVALNDPVPAVREAAAGALSLNKDPASAVAMERYVRSKSPTSLRPQKGPDATWLGARPYPGTTYSFASSDSSALRWEYLTPEPAAKVVAFYKASAKKGPLAAAELRAAYSGKSALDQLKEDAESAGSDSGKSDDSGMPSAEAMAKAMAMAQKMSEQLQKDTAGKSPEEAQKAMMKGAAAQGTPLPIDKYENAEAFGSPRFLVLEEATYLGSVRPLTYVVVYEDKAFGKTGIAILKAPE